MADVHGKGGLDTADLVILTCLQADGRMSNAAVARRVGLSDRAVAARIKKLTRDYGLRIIPTLDIHESCLGKQICIGLKIQPEHLTAVIEALRQMSQISWAMRTTGRYDLVVSAIFVDDEQMQPFVFGTPHTLPGIDLVDIFETIGMAKSPNWDWLT